MSTVARVWLGSRRRGLAVAASGPRRLGVKWTVRDKPHGGCPYPGLSGLKGFIGPHFAVVGTGCVIVFVPAAVCVTVSTRGPCPLCYQFWLPSASWLEVKLHNEGKI